ncbi:hypothetical protein K474DRAFT_1590521 [Panus rudis PR-1116 ss-1]|nr:hypothetical protein K474DRAFT_1590521 [Panus rudis PR-1116 ss-1]
MPVDNTIETEHDPETARPHSIDLTLELERQLDNESLPPNSPAYPRTHSRPQSLDPHVLASIVTQLRMSVAELTRERDELSQALSDARTNESGLKDAIQQVTERCVRLESELEVARDRQQEDANTITLLRGKLEDSRRALMRLQTESRRMSQVSNLDISRANEASNGPPSSRRASFVPLTGSPGGKANAHRRIMSVSGSTTLLGQPNFSLLDQSTTLSKASTDNPQAIDAHSRRLSGFWGRASPPQLDGLPAANAFEVEHLRKELLAVKDQLEETRHELSEAQEAKEASEMCVNALRTFIAENSIGMGASNLGRESSKSVDEGNRQPNSGSSRWGFKLWRADTPITSPPPSYTSPPANSASRTRFGSLFSSRMSVSSSSSNPSTTLPVPESLSSVSDTSSTDDPLSEPISPTSELPRSSVAVHIPGDSQPELPLYTPPTKNSTEEGVVQSVHV